MSAVESVVSCSSIPGLVAAPRRHPGPRIGQRTLPVGQRAVGGKAHREDSALAVLPADHSGVAGGKHRVEIDAPPLPLDPAAGGQPRLELDRRRAERRCVDRLGEGADLPGRGRRRRRGVACWRRRHGALAGPTRRATRHDERDEEGEAGDGQTLVHLGNIGSAVPRGEGCWLALRDGRSYHCAVFDSLGRALVRWRWAVIAIWAVIGVLAAVRAGDTVGMLKLRGGANATTEARVADSLLSTRFSRPISEFFAVTVQGPARMTEGLPGQLLDSLLAAAQPSRSRAASSRCAPPRTRPSSPVMVAPPSSWWR